MERQDQGYLLPSATTEPEHIEALMQALSDEGINIVDEQT